MFCILVLNKITFFIKRQTEWWGRNPNFCSFGTCLIFIGMSPQRQYEMYKHLLSIKNTAIWPIMSLSLTPSFRTTQDLSLFNLAALQPVEMSHPLYQPCISALCPWEDPRAAAVLELLLPAWCSVWCLHRASLPLASWLWRTFLCLRQECTDPRCGRYGKSSRISRWSSAPTFVSLPLGKKSSQQKIGNTSKN